MSIKEFIISLFSKEGLVSSKRWIGTIGLITVLCIVICFHNISDNNLSLLKTLSWIFGVLVGGDSIENVLKSIKIWK